LRLAAKANRKESARSVYQPLVNDQRPMGTRTPEAGGSQGTPHNQDHEHFKALKEQGQFGGGLKKPEALNSEEPRVSTVFESPLRVQRPLPRTPSEQRGETEPFQPNPAEQQAAERLGKPPPKPEAKQDTVQRFAEVQEKLKGFPEDQQKRIRSVYFSWVMDRYKDDIGFHQPGRIMEMIELLDEVIQIYSRENSEK
jgi:hypothetical protein